LSILVTGGAGFIGSNLIEDLLASGEDVVVLDNLHTGSLDNLEGLEGNLKFINESCVNLSKMDLHPKAIYHLGIPSSSPMYKNDPFLVGEAVNGALAIFDLAKREGCKVVYAASSSVYNGLLPPHREDMDILVTDYYTEARLCIERLAELYKRLFGLNSVGLRFFSVYGPNERAKKEYANIITQFLWEMQTGKAPLIYGDGTQTRDFTYVKDVVKALKLAMDYDYHGILNVGTGISHSFNDVIKMLNEKMGENFPPEYEENPIKNYVMHTKADTSKLKKTLGFKAHYTLSEGIDEIMKHYAKN